MKFNNIIGEIYCNKQIWSSAALNSIYKSIFLFVKKNKLESGTTVAINFDRTPYFIVALLVFIDSNITYIPITDEIPIERMKYMMDAADVTSILIDKKEKIILDIEIPHYVYKYKDFEKEEKCGEIRCSAEGIAYVLFTSGSTGLPKAVEVYKKGLINFIEGIKEKIQFPADPVILCLSSQLFDIFILESIYAIYNGMRIVLATEKEYRNPKMIGKLIINAKVNVIQITPSFLKLIELVDNDFQCLRNVQVILVGGESLPQAMLEKLQTKTEAKIYNMYGPTETTIWSSVADLTDKKEVVIGKPIMNTKFYIINKNNEIVDDGKRGEICISGIGLAKGYRNNSEQTEKAFINIMLNEKSTRIYKTGDIGYKNEIGEYVCVGREDLQVKLNGHRIELEEIDECIKQIESINNAVSVLHHDQYGNEIVCFYSADKTDFEDGLKEELKKKMPQYMIPSLFIKVDDFLYTNSNKIDRNAMLKRYLNYDYTDEFFLGDSINIRESIIDILLLVTGKSNDEVQLNKSFDSLGIDSIQFIRFIIEIEKRLGIEVSDELLVMEQFVNIEEFLNQF